MYVEDIEEMLIHLSLMEFVHGIAPIHFEIRESEYILWENIVSVMRINFVAASFQLGRMIYLGDVNLLQPAVL